MNKIMRIGTIDTGNGRRGSIYVTANTERGYLSISGVIGPLPSGNALGGCGQIDMDFAHRNPEHNDERYSNPIKPEEIRYAPNWVADKWLDLLEIWHNWHLKKLEEVPTEVIGAITLLPDTDKIPAWV